MLHLIPSRQARRGDDPIFALNKEATLRKERGENIINATVGSLLLDDGSLAVMPTAARVVREVGDDEWAPYAPISGVPSFLRAVVDDLFRDEPQMRAAACAVATPGGSGALRHAVANFLESGQALLTTNFFWGPYQTLADETDRALATFSMFNDKGNFDVDALDRAIREQVASQGRVLLFLNDPCHNPTGFSMRPEEWTAVTERLLAYADKAPITLLVDTAYFLYGAREPRAFLSALRPLLGKAMLLFAWSASKSFTHYGLRVGALVACVPDERERQKTEAALAYSCRGTWSNCTRGGQIAIGRLLSDPHLRSACDKERAELKDLLLRRVAAFNAVAPSKGLKYPRYEGGFFVTVFHDDAIAKAAAMKEKGVFTVPIEGAIRIALCSVAERDVGRLVDAFSTS